MRRITFLVLFITFLVVGASAPALAGKPTPATTEFDLVGATTLGGGACELVFVWSSPVPKKGSITGWEFARTTESNSPVGSGEVQSLSADTTQIAVTVNGYENFAVRPLFAVTVKGKPTTSSGAWATQGGFWSC